MFEDRPSQSYATAAPFFSSPSHFTPASSALIRVVRKLIGEWLEKLEAGEFAVNPLRLKPSPRLPLENGFPPQPAE